MMDDTSADNGTGSENGEDRFNVVVMNPRSNKPAFGGMTPAEASKKSIEARRAKATQRHRDAALTKAAAELKIKNAPPRDKLKGAAAAVLFDLAERILAEDIPINTAREAASVADVFFNILRLESGQSTSNVEHMTQADKMAAIKEMQAQARERAQATGRSLPPAP